MPKKYYALENCYLNGEKTSGIFYGEWSQISLLTHGKQGVRIIASNKKFDPVKIAFHKETQVTANGYFKFDKYINDFEWTGKDESDEDKNEGENSEDEIPTKAELNKLKNASYEDNFTKSLYILDHYKHSYLIDEHRQSPTHWAAIKGYDFAINLLIQHHRFDINAQDKWGNTALHKAVEHENTETVKLLLSLKAKKNIRRKSDKKLPIDLAHELSPEKRKAITTLFPSITTGYFKIKFDGTKISELIFNRRYMNRSNIPYKELQKKQPNCFENSVGTNEIKVKTGFEVCHKKSDYTITCELQKAIVGKTCSQASALMQNKGIRYPHDNPNVIDRLHIACLLFEYYKSISIDPENLFIDTKERNGAFGFLSSIAARFASKTTYVEIHKTYYPYLIEIKELAPYIQASKTGYNLRVSNESIGIIRQSADRHFEFFSQENEKSNAKKQAQNLSNHGTFSKNKKRQLLVKSKKIILESSDDEFSEENTKSTAPKFSNKKT